MFYRVFAFFLVASFFYIFFLHFFHFFSLPLSCWWAPYLCPLPGPPFARPTAKRSRALHSTTKGRVPGGYPFPPTHDGRAWVSLSFQVTMTAPHSDDFPPAYRHHRSIPKDTSEILKPVRFPGADITIGCPRNRGGFPPFPLEVRAVSPCTVLRPLVSCCPLFGNLCCN